MTRPCRWPEGGCGAEIIDVVTVNGRKQVLDAQPTKGIVLMDRFSGGQLVSVGGIPDQHLAALVMDVYTDHHATCPKWAAKIERDRADRQVEP